MRRKRALTEEERELFEATLGDAKPLKKSPRRPKKKPATQQIPAVPPKPNAERLGSRRGSG